MGGSEGFFLITENGAWTYIPMRSPTPNKLPDDALAGMQTEMDIAGPLVDYVAKGHKATLIGKDTLDGNPCYKILLITKGGKEIKYWIDATTFLLTQSASKGGGMFGSGRKNPDAESVVLYKDYSAEEGILFPHTIEIKSTNAEGRGGGGTTFDKFEINKPVDPKLYKPE